MEEARTGRNAAHRNVFATHEQSPVRSARSNDSGNNARNGD